MTNQCASAIFPSPGVQCPEPCGLQEASAHTGSCSCCCVACPLLTGGSGATGLDLLPATPGLLEADEVILLLCPCDLPSFSSPPNTLHLGVSSSGWVPDSRLLSLDASSWWHLCVDFTVNSHWQTKQAVGWGNQWHEGKHWYMQTEPFPSRKNTYL